MSHLLLTSLNGARHYGILIVVLPLSETRGHHTYKFEVMVVQEERSENKLKIVVDSEHTKCSICLNVWHDVVTVAPCLHNFGNGGCFSEWLRRCQNIQLFYIPIVGALSILCHKEYPLISPFFQVDPLTLLLDVGLKL